MSDFVGNANCWFSHAQAQNMSKNGKEPNMVTLKVAIVPCCSIVYMKTDHFMTWDQLFKINDSLVNDSLKFQMAMYCYFFC